MQQSSKRNPCPCCGRNSDGDCRFSDSVVFCHNGSTFAPPQHLRIGDTIAIDGKPWALVKLNAGFDGAAHCFRPHRERNKASLLVRRTQAAVRAIEDVEKIKHQLADFDLICREALGIPPLEQMHDSDIMRARDACEAAHKTAKQLITRLTRVKRQDPSMGPVLEAVTCSQRCLRFQLKDLNEYCDNPAKYWEAHLLKGKDQVPDESLAEESDWAFWNVSDNNYQPSDPSVAALYNIYRGLPE